MYLQLLLGVDPGSPRPGQFRGMCMSVGKGGQGVAAPTLAGQRGASSDLICISGTSKLDESVQCIREMLSAVQIIRQMLFEFESF